MNDLDTIDLAILAQLQEDGRISNAELAQRVGLAPATVLRRVKLLEEKDYIRGYAAQLNPLLLGMHVTAFVLVDIDKGSDYVQMSQRFSEFPEVQEVHRVIGEWCYMLKVRTTTPQALESLLAETLWKLGGVRRTMTIMATSSPHEVTTLPLATAADAAAVNTQG